MPGSHQGDTQAARVPAWMLQYERSTQPSYARMHRSTSVMHYARVQTIGQWVMSQQMWMGHWSVP